MNNKLFDKCDLIAAFDDDSFLVYELKEGMYIIVGLDGNRKIQVCNNWIWLLRHRDYATRVDNTYKRFREGLQIIKDNRDEVEDQMCSVYGIDHTLIEWQKDLLNQAKIGQKMIF